MRAIKLTNTIAGWKVAGQSKKRNGATIVKFAHGARMSLVTDTKATFPVGKVVHAARQTGTSFNLDFEDGSSTPVTLGGPTSSVQVEDKDGTILYFD